MANLSEEEALALVVVRGHCDDLDTWRRVTAREETWEIRAGLIDDSGIRQRQSVVMRITRASSGSWLRFLVTLFRDTEFEQQSIYQLELQTGERRPTSRHQSPHEHMGTSRWEGEPEWATWGLERVLAHFCKRTNIYFNPVPPNPFLPSKEKRHAHKHH